MSRANVDGPRKVNVLVIAENLDSSMLQQAPLQKTVCQWQFVQSREEMSRLLIHTKIDMVLSLDARQGLCAVMALLAGSRVSMFYRLPVEEGCWWVPVVRNGQNCLGEATFRRNDFSHVFAKLVRSIAQDAATSGVAGS